MRVLIVDDHPLNLKLLRVQLEAEGHEVREAANGAVALELLGIEPVDAVISDILMPQMDGFRLCLEIRKSEAIAHLPFILYTSTYSSPEDRQLAEIVGADRYVVKPAPARAIFDALRDATLIRREAPSSDPPPEADETFVLQQYSEALVVKLEEKNTELHDALQRLQQAHDEILALNRDLERRVEQRTFALVAANRELEAFSYSVSHDLRAPLRAISGYCDILRTEWGNGMSEEAVSLLGRIGANTQKLNTLIEDLLHYSRLGRQALRIQPVNIQQLTQECLADLRNEREGRSVDIEIGELPPWRADIILLKQVLSTLISNALKYTG